MAPRLVSGTSLPDPSISSARTGTGRPADLVQAGRIQIAQIPGFGRRDQDVLRRTGDAIGGLFGRKKRPQESGFDAAAEAKAFEEIRGSKDAIKERIAAEKDPKKKAEMQAQSDALYGKDLEKLDDAKLAAGKAKSLDPASRARLIHLLGVTRELRESDKYFDASGKEVTAKPFLDAKAQVGMAQRIMAEKVKHDGDSKYAVFFGEEKNVPLELKATWERYQGLMKKVKDMLRAEKPEQLSSNDEIALMEMEAQLGLVAAGKQPSASSGGETQIA